MAKDLLGMMIRSVVVWSVAGAAIVAYRQQAQGQPGFHPEREQMATGEIEAVLRLQPERF